MIPRKVRAVLEAHGLEALEFERGSTATAATAADRSGVSVGQIAKSILLVDKRGGRHMVVCAGDRRLVNARLKRILGVKTRMANAEETREATGFDPGGVCPFGIQGVEIFIDRSLEAYDAVYPGAGTASSGVPTTFAQLVEITGGGICDVTE